LWAEIVKTKRKRQIKTNKYAHGGARKFKKGCFGLREESHKERRSVRKAQWGTTGGNTRRITRPVGGSLLGGKADDKKLAHTAGLQKGHSKKNQRKDGSFRQKGGSGHCPGVNKTRWEKMKIKDEKRGKKRMRKTGKKARHEKKILIGGWLRTWAAISTGSTKRKLPNCCKPKGKKQPGGNLETAKLVAIRGGGMEKKGKGDEITITKTLMKQWTQVGPGVLAIEGKS